MSAPMVGGWRAVVAEDGGGQETTARTSYRQRLFVEHDLGESSGSAVDVTRRAGKPLSKQMTRKMLRNVEKRGVQAARTSSKKPITDRLQDHPKSFPESDLGIPSNAVAHHFSTDIFKTETDLAAVVAAWARQTRQDGPGGALAATAVASMDLV